MLSFEVSAIDIILVISVVVLLIFYLTKLSGKTPEESGFRQPMVENACPEKQASGFEEMKECHTIRGCDWKPNLIGNRFQDKTTKTVHKYNDWNIEKFLDVTTDEKEARIEGRLVTERDPAISESLLLNRKNEQSGRKPT